MTTIRADDVDLARDRVLVERFQAGDDHAFEELFRRYFDRLCRFCERRVGDRDSAEEIAQEAFARALVGLPSFSGERRFYPWMTVIARRLCVDRHRERVRATPEPTVERMDGSVESAGDEVGEVLALRAELDALDQALERVRDRHREVLRLREWEGLSYQAIAARLEVPVTTVEALLHRARRAVRREFLSVVDAGRVVVLPILAVLALARTWSRRAAARIAATPTGPSPSAGAALLAGLGAALLVAAPVESPDDGGPSPPPPPPAAVERAGASPDPVAADGPPVPSSDGRRAADEAPEPPAPPEPSAEVGSVDVYLGPDGSREAAEESDDLPVSEEVGPAFVGLDPPRIATDVKTTLPEANGGLVP